MFIEATPETVIEPAIVKSDKAVQILERALERVQEGWCQGTLHDDADEIEGYPESYCLVGSVQWEGYDLMLSGGTVSVALRYLVEVIGLDHYGDLTGWNDAPWREQEQVVAAIEQAIERRKYDLNMTGVTRTFAKGGGA